MAVGPIAPPHRDWASRLGITLRGAPRQGAVHASAHRTGDRLEPNGSDRPRARRSSRIERPARSEPRDPVSRTQSSAAAPSALLSCRMSGRELRQALAIALEEGDRARHGFDTRTRQRANPSCRQGRAAIKAGPTSAPPCCPRKPGRAALLLVRRQRGADASYLRGPDCASLPMSDAQPPTLASVALHWS